MTESYSRTRDQLEVYFDQTALKAWELMTNDSPLSGVRARVRSGRDEMRQILLGSLPDDLTDARVLDAGCGTGQVSVELAKRGAKVLGVDISSNLIRVANERTPPELVRQVNFKVGDMLSGENGNFDYVIAMDSLIHYGAEDIVAALSKLAKNTNSLISFTIAPKTPLLMALLIFGKIFPRSNRSPNILPVSKTKLDFWLSRFSNLVKKDLVVLKRVHQSFYVSEALTLKL